MRSVLKITFLFVVLIMVIAGFSVYLTFFKVVPDLNDNVHLPGLAGETAVHWDDYQIPHISARHEMDVFRVMGYLHAQDRLWQMTLNQYRLEGLHSREIHKELVDVDRFYLTMGFGETAKKAYENMARQDKQMLQAYADGINGFIEQNGKHLPIEFSLSNARPVPWEPWHSIGIQLLWAWQHQHSFWSKPALSALQYQDESVIVRALTGLDIPPEVLFGPEDPDLKPIEFEQLAQSLFAFSDPAAPMRVSPSGTGFAFSSNGADPLRLLSVSRETLLDRTAVGYEVMIMTPMGVRGGLTIPGFPAIIIGQNEHMAWALQPLVSDDGDFFTGPLFTETPAKPVKWETDPDLPERLAEGVTLHRHILTLKQGGEVQIVTRKINGRPIVAISEENNKYLAFDWPGRTHSADMRAWRDLTLARYPEELMRTVASISTPAVQGLFVSADGRSGRMGGGRVVTDPNPLRIRDRDGQFSQATAADHIPMPGEAGHKQVFLLDQTGSTRAYVGNNGLFSPPWNRSDRISELLDETPSDRLLAGIITRWHNDTYSLFAAELTPYISRHLQSHADDPAIAPIIPYLLNWEYGFGPNETAATLFELFMDRASANLYQAFMSDDAFNRIRKTPNISYRAVAALLIDEDRWPSSHPYSHSEWIHASMSEAAHQLKAAYGPEPHDWQWGRVVEYKAHDVLFAETRRQNRSARMAEKYLFNPVDANISGSPHSLQALHADYGETVRVTAASTMKHVMLLRPELTYYAVSTSGQSGNVFSDHYNDQIQLWNDGLMRPAISMNPTQSPVNSKQKQHFSP
ncbi:MAG: penicillin acylase family protein [Cyclonatronaceae bacterium]